MSRLSLRVRLAALIGVLLLISGVVLLATSYGLVTSSLNAPLAGTSALPDAPAASFSLVETQRALAKRTRDQLVTEYLAVLAGVLLVAVVLGWLLAGRLLRSVRRITAVARRVTGRNLDERVRLDGPRDELRELADTFDGMLARLDAVFSAQRRFIADASHELRTPLTAMRVELEVLAADPNAAVTDIEAATVVLRRQFARSEELINALLALARSEPELLDREPVDFAEIAGEALDEVAADVGACRLRIDSELAPAPAEADRRLLALLAVNLLSNATKYNHEDGWIAVRTAVEAHHAMLVVTNSGSIVSAAEVNDLTQAFRRGGQTRLRDGHGLGLSLVAAVVRAHHGQLNIEARSEGGLRVEVSLPLATGSSAEPRRDRVTGRSTRDRTRCIPG